MPENIGALNPDFPPFGRMNFNGQEVTHHMDVMDIPKGKGREVCIQHLREGKAGELLDEFWMMGCQVPEKDEPQIVRTAIVCSGPSMFKKCRMRLLQAKTDGEVIAEGKFSS